MGEPLVGAMVGTPSIVLSAFASELLLKCMLILEEKKAPDSHQLHTLYGQIGHTARRRIEEMCDAETRPKIEAFAKAVDHGMAADLPNALFQSSRAFERQRYAYEDWDSLRFQLSDLPGILIRYIVELRPE